MQSFLFDLCYSTPADDIKRQRSLVSNKYIQVQRLRAHILSNNLNTFWHTLFNVQRSGNIDVVITIAGLVI